MSLHPKASESLSLLLDTFQASLVSAGAMTSESCAHSPSTFSTNAPVVRSKTQTTPMLSASLHQGAGAVPGSYSSQGSTSTVEETEHHLDHNDVFGHIDLPGISKTKGPLTSVTSTGPIWRGSLADTLKGQGEPSGAYTQKINRPSRMASVWRDTRIQQEEGVSTGEMSALSNSPGSMKESVHIKTPAQSGMPSPNVEIYSTANTPGKENLHSLYRSQEQMQMQGQVKAIGSDASRGQKWNLRVQGEKKEERPVVPFYYGSKIPVMVGKLANPTVNKHASGNNPTRPAGTDSPSTSPTSRLHSTTTTSKTRAPRSSSTSQTKVLTRRDTIAGHFPGTPPKSGVVGTSNGGRGGSPRPRSSSKIPIPTTPTSPRPIVRRHTDFLPFRETLSGAIDTDCDGDGDPIWEQRRNDVMGPLGISPTTRLGGFVHPTSLTRISRAATMPMGSLVGNAMSLNDL